MRAEFVAITSGGALIGGGGVVIERRAGQHWIHALPWLLPGAPWAAPGAAAEVDRAFAGALAARACELRAAGGTWAAYRPDDPVDRAALEPVGGETRRVEAALIELGEGVEPAWRRIERRGRQELDRARRDGLRFAEEPEALEAAVALHRAQSRGWPGHRPLPIELSRRLLAPGSGAPAARLFTVRDSRGLLAATLALIHPREVMAWWSGTHPDGRRRHAFAFLLWSLAEWAAARGAARLNLGASAGREGVILFKRALGAVGHPYPVRWLDDRHAPPLGRLAAGLQRLQWRGRDRGERA